MDTLAESILEHVFSLADPGGGFQPSRYPGYLGIADGKVSDLAATVYAAEIAQTLGAELPYREATADYLQTRQDEAGFFHNLVPLPGVSTTEYLEYNTCVGLRGLRAVGCRPKHDPRPWLEAGIRRLSQGFVPGKYFYDFCANSYAALEEQMPADCAGILQDALLQYQDPETGWIIHSPDFSFERNNPMTFHAVRVFHLTGAIIPMAEKILETFLQVQQDDGSWSRGNVHGTFDACVTIRILGKNTQRCRTAIERGAEWALTCRTEDGGFNHFGDSAPDDLSQHNGNWSEMDACYFHVSTLVMAGHLPSRLAPDNNWIGWGHSLTGRDWQEGEQSQ